MKRCLSILLCCTLLLTGCARQDAPPVSLSAPESRHPHAELQYKYNAEIFDVFDTYTTVLGYASSQKEFDGYVRIIEGELLRLHRLFDIYNDYEGINNLKTVNDNAGIAPVEVDASVIDLLARAKRAYADTGGTVNVAMGSVLRVWHDCRTQALADPQSARLPDAALLAAAARHTAIEDLVLDRKAGTVYLRDSGMSLDVGALAKGYAAQAAVDLAREAGFASVVLSAGGNVVTAGAPADGRDNWSVGIQSPDGAADFLSSEILDTVYIRDMSAVTSGDYQRFFVADGERYHHIIDPGTLYPARQVRAVTVIHPDSTQADILSTAAYILPIDKAMALVEAQGGEAVWLLEGNTMTETAGYRKISKKHGAAG